MSCHDTQVPIRQVQLLLLLVVLFLLPLSPVHSFASGQATLLRVDGPIGPAISDYLVRGIEKSADLEAEAIIIQINTPGGLDHSMRQIIREILASPVPVITYVAPDGSRAASAGTFILYASHIAAMAPATNLGAASPVMVGGMPDQPDQTRGQGEDESADKGMSTLERKMTNDASAYIESLALRHGRNAEWAVKAVEEAASINAAEALEIGVINLIASDLDQLLEKTDGREVSLESGKHRIVTKGVSILAIEQSWRTRILAVISDPNIAYILMLLGIYGLIYEMTSPGFFLPGVIGGISLILALYAFQVLPVNYSGLALIILGIVLLIGEAFVPSFGSLGIGGIIAFATGSLILIRDDELSISPVLIIGTVAVTAILLFLLIGRLILIRRHKIETGEEAMIGTVGEVAEDFQNDGRIWILGESWLARYSGTLIKGEKVIVTGTDGLFLTIAKHKEV